MVACSDHSEKAPYTTYRWPIVRVARPVTPCNHRRSSSYYLPRPTHCLLRRTVANLCAHTLTPRQGAGMVSTTKQAIYANAAFFTSAERPWADAMLVTGEQISYVGDLATARRIARESTEEIDLNGALVVPGFVDGHAHVLNTGASLMQLDLMNARDLQEIQSRLRSWAADHPDAPRLRAHAWRHQVIPGERPTRQMLDVVVPDRPVYARSRDGHSIWLNSAALSEVGIDAATQAPPGGAISRDPQTGEPTGYIDEVAVGKLVGPVLADRETDSDRDRQLAQVLAAYGRHGITATTDMGLGEDSLAAMARAENAGLLTARMLAHWRIQPDVNPAATIAQVQHAAELAATYRSEWLRIIGVKFVVDGVVDGCTAALGEPYEGGQNPGPIWELDMLAPAVAAADAAGLQVAMHAIGDDAVRIAIDAVEYAIRENGPGLRRHRIEHLELATREDVERLASLGIIASVQPVHTDPVARMGWPTLIGESRIRDLSFPYTELAEAGALLPFGSDSPTHTYEPLRNLYIAATRCSVIDPSLPPFVPRHAIPVAAGVVHATRDSAWAARAEHSFGQLRAGLLADFVALERNIFDLPPDELLSTPIQRTFVGGRCVYAA